MTSPAPVVARAHVGEVPVCSGRCRCGSGSRGVLVEAPVVVEMGITEATSGHGGVSRASSIAAVEVVEPAVAAVDQEMVDSALEQKSGVQVDDPPESAEVAMEWI